MNKILFARPVFLFFILVTLAIIEGALRNFGSSDCNVFTITLEIFLFVFLASWPLAAFVFLTKNTTPIKTIWAIYIAFSLSLLGIFFIEAIGLTPPKNSLINIIKPISLFLFHITYWIVCWHAAVSVLQISTSSPLKISRIFITFLGFYMWPIGIFYLQYRINLLNFEPSR